MQIKFKTVDVFTEQQFGGNPLAVISDARGLSSAQMQAIASEFNLSETTFVLPPKDPAHTAEVRIFTPRAEMPFAGHPNVGTAFVLAHEAAAAGKPVADTMTFAEKAGLVRMQTIRNGSTIIGARLSSPQVFSRGEPIAPDIIASACSVSEDDIETRQHQPCVISCGALFVAAELKSLNALARALPRAEIFARHLPVERATGIHLYVQTNSGGVDIQSRMFAPLFGVNEDPATGSANVALIGLLAQLRGEKELTLSKTIAQGIEMGRPSLMEASAEKRGGAVTATMIGGPCVAVSSGIIELS
jgi:trans-2,3-dihydro-3-hydroxyanthranilate isomerase